MNIKNINGKLVFPFFFIACLIVISCSDSNVPTTPNYPPNVFADVSGTFEIRYMGQGSIFLISKPFGVMMNSFYRDSVGTDYFMGINMYFSDSTVKTGRFKIVDSPDTLKDYAVAYFETGKNENKKTFISYYGEINITEISLSKVIADFEFLAKDKSGSTVMIKNGYMSIIE